jgi:hypothetical protein
MQRDMGMYAQCDVWRLKYQQELFGAKKAHAISVAFDLVNSEPDNAAYLDMLHEAFDMVFVFEKNKTNYGSCAKFDKPVSFIPATCQIDTQECFVHRRD